MPDVAGDLGQRELGEIVIAKASQMRLDERLVHPRELLRQQVTVRLHGALSVHRPHLGMQQRKKSPARARSRGPSSKSLVAPYRARY